MKPEFIDNREVTMAEALRGYLNWLRQHRCIPPDVSIATGYFNPEGFLLIADDLLQAGHVRLLLGAEPLPPAVMPMRQPRDPRGDRFRSKLLNDALQKHEHALKRDRDLLPFEPGSNTAVRRLLEFLGSGKVEVRRFEKAFLHGKAFVFSGEEGVIAGSSNFTAAGMVSNLELNLGRYDPTPVHRVQQWFDRLWEESEPYNLAAVYSERFCPFDPYLLYLRVLLERYGIELEEETDDIGRIRLTTFQNDGIFRAVRIAEQYGGVLVADGVGLGKSFIGGELIRQAVEDRRQRALLIAPATLRDGTWKSFADRHQLHMETVSYEQLANDRQLGGAESYLKVRANEYALVVVDEAQAFRNPETQRARALRRLLAGKPRKTLVLMSATPVNNSLWDLYYLLGYFVRNDAAFSQIGIRSMKERFAQAADHDPDTLQPDVLFDLLDQTVVWRTRNFVRRFYPNDRIIGPGGKEIPVTFPDPHVKSVTYSLDDVLPGFFPEFARALAAEEGEPGLTLARYTPSRYLRRGRSSEDEGIASREAGLAGLLRSMLLKRFESSVHAFANTVGKMAAAHESFLAGLDNGVILTADGIEEWEQTDTDDLLLFLERTGSTSARAYDTVRLRADVESDLRILRRFHTLAGRIVADRDPKLRKLVGELASIARQASEDGISEEGTRNRRKVIVFSYFADTVEWAYRYLVDAIAADRRLAAFRGRVAAISGDESFEGVSRERAVFGFAPASSEAPPGLDDDRFDVLVTTDVLAEGVNLQQAANIINYDLPWNPMRLVQRHGRIDRIGSPHRDVYIRCFFPDKQLEDLLALEERIRHKLAQAAASVGIESEVIPGTTVVDTVFAENREQIEKLRGEDAAIFENAGEDPSAHSGEEYRQELRKGLTVYGDRVTNLPWGTGSGFIGGPVTGHFFCARIGERVFLRFVDWQNRAVVNNTLECLRRIQCRPDTARWLDAEFEAGAYGAWEVARTSIFDEWTRDTDPANLQPKVRATLRAAADQLRRNPPPDTSQEELNRLLESLEAPWGARIERQIRECSTGREGIEASTAIKAKVRELGLEPYAPPRSPTADRQGRDHVDLLAWSESRVGRHGPVPAQVDAAPMVGDGKRHSREEPSQRLWKAVSDGAVL